VTQGERFVTFHAGLPKTGSSAIQQALRDDHEVLLTQGIFYPRMRDVVADGIDGPVGAVSKPRFKGGHMPIARALTVLGRGESDPVSETILTRTMDGFAASGCGRLLLSSESLGLRSPTRLQALPAQFSGLSREVALFFRRKDDWILSRYKQQIKDYRRSHQSLAEFVSAIDADGVNYFAISARLLRFLDTDRLYAIDYDRVRANVLGALFSAMGRSDLYSDVPSRSASGGRSVNASLSNLASLFLMHANTVLTVERQQKAARDALYQVDAEIVATLGEVDLMPPDLRHWAISSHNAEIAELNDRFGASLEPIDEPGASARGEIRESLSPAELQVILAAIAPHLAPEPLSLLNAALSGREIAAVAGAPAEAPADRAVTGEASAAGARMHRRNEHGPTDEERAARRAARKEGRRGAELPGGEERGPLPGGKQAKLKAKEARGRGRWRRGGETP